MHPRMVRIGKGRKFRKRVVINPYIRKKAKVSLIFRSSRKRRDISTFKQIADRARAKGYNIPPIDIRRGPVVVEHNSIPENFYIDAFTVPVEDALSAWDSRFARQKGKGKYYVGIDDDAPLDNRRRSFAHELGHITQIQQNIKPHTELKADKIGADILDMPLEKFREDIVFDQDFLRAGIQLPRKIPKTLLKRAEIERIQLNKRYTK